MCRERRARPERTENCCSLSGRRVFALFALHIEGAPGGLGGRCDAENKRLAVKSILPRRRRLLRVVPTFSARSCQLRLTGGTRIDIVRADIDEVLPAEVPFRL